MGSNAVLAAWSTLEPSFLLRLVKMKRTPHRAASTAPEISVRWQSTGYKLKSVLCKTCVLQGVSLCKICSVITMVCRPTVGYIKLFKQRRINNKDKICHIQREKTVLV